jgi:phosphopentomutase
MARALLIVLDSVGIGGAEDAVAYGDVGADTVGHIAEACADGRGDCEGLRQGPLNLPHMAALGLGLACEASTGRMPPNLAPRGALKGAWGYGVETSKGKDTPLAIGKSWASPSPSTGAISPIRCRPFPKS